MSEHLPSFCYYFDGYTGKHWPTHDPLWKNGSNQKKNVVDPHGNIQLFEPSSKDIVKNSYIHISFRGD